jgi:hypothetical protein
MSYENSSSTNMATDETIIPVKSLFDMRAEAFIAMMSTHYAANTQLEQWMLVTAGASKKRSSTEVQEVQSKIYNDETVYYVKTNRKGLFDNLPQGLFLDLEGEYESPTERTRAFERQIKEARKFFLPFEQAIYMPSISAEVLEQRLTETFPDFLESFWGLERYRDCLDERQRQILYHLLPETHRITGDWALTSRCFELILQYPIMIQFAAPKEYPNPQGEIAALELSLGDDTIVGTTFKDDTPTVEITVCEVPYALLDSFLEDGKGRKLLEEVLYGFFLPLEAAVETVISMRESDMGFELGKSTLGYDVKFI